MSHQNYEQGLSQQVKKVHISECGHREATGDESANDQLDRMINIVNEGHISKHNHREAAGEESANDQRDWMINRSTVDADSRSSTPGRACYRDYGNSTLNEGQQSDCQ